MLKTNKRFSKNLAIPNRIVSVSILLPWPHGSTHHLPQHRLLHRLAHRPSHQDSFQVSENLWERFGCGCFGCFVITLRTSALVAWLGTPSFTASQPLSERVTLNKNCVQNLFFTFFPCVISTCFLVPDLRQPHLRLGFVRSGRPPPWIKVNISKPISPEWHRHPELQPHRSRQTWATS